MFSAKSLESLIRDKIFLGKVSNTGYHQVKCAVCNDYKVRAGFKFDGDTIGYSCFNCGTKTIYKENSGEISKKMRSVLKDFGISDSEINDVVNVAFFNKPVKEQNISLTSLDVEKVNTFTAETTLPKGSIRLGATTDDNEIQSVIKNYLIKRHVDPNSYPFFYSLDLSFKNRVIIPFYRNKKLIYWQARAISDDSPRYLNCEVPKTAVLFNFDQLYSWSDLPLFVCEGVFDALPLNGVCTLGSELNAAKIELLRQSKRRLIFIIDRDKNGENFANKALSNGWEISFAPEGCDANSAITKYGKLWTLKFIMDNIPSSKINAELQIKLNCKKQRK